MRININGKPVDVKEGQNVQFEVVSDWVAIGLVIIGAILMHGIVFWL